MGDNGGIGDIGATSFGKVAKETWKSGCSFCELASVAKHHSSKSLHIIKVERQNAFRAAELFLKQRYETCLKSLDSKEEEADENLAEGPIHPKMLDKMQPNDLKRILHEAKGEKRGLRKKSRWMAQEEEELEEKESDEDDVSFPTGTKRLLGRGF